MKPKRIFISYRRDDTAAAARLVFDRLRNFGSDVYFDVSTIRGGEDFEKSINAAIGASDVVLVLIGKNWLAPAQPGALPRLHEDGDYVRAEVSASLARPILVLPVLVDGAKMPAAAALPEDVRKITTRNAILLRHESFDDDAENLIAAALGSERKRRPGDDRRKPVRTALYGLAGAAAGLVLAGIIALLHNAVWNRPLSESIGESGTILLLIACPLLGLWGGIARAIR